LNLRFGKLKALSPSMGRARGVQGGFREKKKMEYSQQDLSALSALGDLFQPMHGLRFEKQESTMEERLSAVLPLRFAPKERFHPVAVVNASAAAG
jgi:hypothetical protein